MILPVEIINKILSYRPCHPISIMIEEKIEIYYVERLDYYGEFSKSSGNRPHSPPLLVHEVMSFQEWCFLSIQGRL